MPNLRTRSALVATLLLGALGCSDSSDDPSPASSGAGGASLAGAGGNAGAAGSAAGTAGVGGAAGASGAAGAGGSVGEGDAGFPVPDKLVALTFDDGPDATLTAAVLDKLEAYDVPASFFLVGQNIGAGTQAVIDRAAALGCTFENHSSDYNALSALTADEIETRVNTTSAAILAATGTSPAFFRAPNLDVSPLMFETIDLPFAGGLLGLDYPAEFGGNPTVEGVTNTILNGVQDGTIILLHDVQPSLNPQPTPLALDVIIPTLKERGYEFVTLRALFERRGVDPSSQEIQWQQVPPSN